MVSGRAKTRYTHVHYKLTRSSVILAGGRSVAVNYLRRWWRCAAAVFNRVSVTRSRSLKAD